MVLLFWGWVGEGCISRETTPDKRHCSDHGERAQMPLSYLDMVHGLKSHSSCHFEDNQMCSALRKEVLMCIFSNPG